MKDKRSTDAIDAAMRYANGEITREELNKYIVAAAFDAYAAATATAAFAAAYATDAANCQATADICREILTEKVFEKIKNYEQPN
jgi:CRISPR/Cas system-associated protein Csm6